MPNHDSTAESDAPTCAHVHAKSWRKFGGTMLSRCLDCGADSRDDRTVNQTGSPAAGSDHSDQAGER